MLFYCVVAAVLAASAHAAAATKKSTPPAFFIQDPSDSQCLAGEEFKRCSIETLFYVLGEPGMCKETHDFYI
jgi:hypothetical protein